MRARAAGTEARAQYDVWAEGAGYEAYIGRWSRLIASEFLAWLAPPVRARWLDLGCGSGALSQAICSACAPGAVLALDRSFEFVRHVRSGARPPLACTVGDGLQLPLAAGSFDRAVSGLVLNFLPAPAAALAELRRSVRPGGVVAVYVWDYAEGMEMLRRFWDAAVRLDGAAAVLDEGRRFPMCRPDPLRALFSDAGLEGVAVTPIEVAARFRDFDDFWRPFLGGQGPAPGYVASLPERGRRALREAVHASLPRAPDGSITLRARAWAARGTAP